MDRPRGKQDRILDLLREVQLRLSRGELLATVCKSMGISQSSYRRWQIRYGERAKEIAAAAASDSSKRSPGAPWTSTENVPQKAVKVSPSGKGGKLSVEAKDLLDEANGASEAARNAWLAFLALLTYLLVTLASVSHKDLLLNSPIKLPIVNVDIPLFSFFQYAPALLLLVYLSLLIQHVILARKYRKFTEAISPYEKKAQTEHSARELVHSYLVSQTLAGPKPNPIRNWLTLLIIWVTFTLLPLITLLYFQGKFLPYHEIWITYWHRLAVLLALAMLFGVMPLIYPWSRKPGVKIGPQEEPWQTSRAWMLLGALSAILVLVISWLIATVPNERVDRAIGFVPPTSFVDLRDDESLLNPIVRFVYPVMRFLHELMTDADSREDERSLLRYLVSYRVLIVEDTDFVPDEGDKQNEVSIVLRERNLQFARLSRSDLHRADLTKADLSGGVLFMTRLEKAELPGARLQSADLSSAKLQEVDLTRAQFQGANLREAQLQGTNLPKANLHGANFEEANLQGANLREAQLQGAIFFGASLQGADLSKAKLQGASLVNAQLQSADLHGAQLQGADLRSAELQGADLSVAQLQGADLRGADLKGADLTDAGLHYADLRGADLKGADLTDAGVWLASFPIDLADQSPVPLGVAEVDMSPPTPEAKAELRGELQASIAGGKTLERLVDRLNPILRDDPPKWEDEDSWNQYVSQEQKPSPDELAQFLAGMACQDTKGHVATRMARRAEDYSEDDSRRHYAKALAHALLNEDCKGVNALSDEMRERLEKVRMGAW